MDNKKDYVETAKNLFNQGYNCAQAVTGAFCDQMGLDLQSAIKLASSFGGGIGGLRQACGALTGMFMVVGWIFGYDDPQNDQIKTEHYALVKEMAARFEAKHQSIICKELLEKAEIDKIKNTPSKRTKEYYATRPCVEFVATAAEMTEELIKKQRHKEGIYVNSSSK